VAGLAIPHRGAVTPSVRAARSTLLHKTEMELSEPSVPKEDTGMRHFIQAQNGS
jgi:hypothetical protein